MILFRLGTLGLGLLVMLLVLGHPAQARPDPACSNTFPADNVWNTAVDTLPLHPQSAAWIAVLGGGGSQLDPNFSAAYWQGAPNGVPFVLVAGQPLIQVTPQAYRSESDFGPAPIPTNAPVQGGPNAGGDRHVLVVDTGGCVLYEMYHAHPLSNGSWWADSTALWALSSNALRPNGWTSSDAAGLPIQPALLKYAEVAAGNVTHAARFTADQSHIRSTWVWPARHSDGTGGSSVLPMGTRLRLKATVNPAGFAPQAATILRGLQRYGMVLADSDPGNPDLGLGGEPAPGWSDNALNSLRSLHASDFEVVDSSVLMVDPNSAQARLPNATPAVPSTPTATATRPPTRTATATITPTAPPTQSAHPLICWPYPACAH